MRPQKRTRVDTMASHPETLSPKASVLRGSRLVALQFGLLVVISALFAFLDLDRTITSFFYDPDQGWFMGRHAIWGILYHYGTLPAMLMTLICLIVWLISFFKGRLARWRPYLLLVVLTTTIACGLLVNGILKTYWGRPRPNQITEFGGHYQYRHILPPGTPGKGASFPSGHSAMGFAFLSLAFWRRRAKAIAYAGLTTGVVLGGLLSAARLVKGAHFPTDMLWSLGIVLMTATVLYYFVLKIPVRSSELKKTGLAKKGQKAALILLICVAGMLIGGAFMTRRPFYKTTQYRVPLATEIQRMEIRINTDPEKLSVKTGEQGAATVLLHASGMGWAWVDYAVETDFHTRDRVLSVSLKIDARSYFAELDHSIEVILPSEKQKDMPIEVLPLETKP